MKRMGKFRDEVGELKLKGERKFSLKNGKAVIDMVYQEIQPEDYFLNQFRMRQIRLETIDRDLERLVEQKTLLKNRTVEDIQKEIENALLQFEEMGSKLVREKDGLKDILKDMQVIVDKIKETNPVVWEKFQKGVNAGKGSPPQEVVPATGGA